MTQPIDNLRINNLKALAAPALVIEEVPMSDDALATVAQARHEAHAIIHGQDDRLLVIVGPCSIHDPKAALEYAERLKGIIPKYQHALQLVMRVYFEKPRTTVGWKGLINDPDLDGSFNINKGLYLARRLLHDINTLGVPTASEFLDTTIPQYISDLTAWSAIGARTTESQIHRELASGLSMPLGFKNSTTGNIEVAIDAVCAARHPHHFLGVSKQGVAAIVSTYGNEDTHIILRGGKDGPNYEASHIAHATALLQKAGLPPYLMVDLSHGNSRKEYRRQAEVANELCAQLQNGAAGIMGIMLESNLVEGNQALQPEKALTYGQSITDACVNLETTQEILDTLAHAQQQRRQKSVSQEP